MYCFLEYEDLFCSEEDVEVDVDEVLMSILVDCYNSFSMWQVWC